MLNRLGLTSILLGVGSFMISALGWGIFLGFVIGQPEWAHGHESSGLMTAMGIFMVLTTLAYPIGLILGIVGLFRKESERALCIFGVVLNTLALLGIALLVLLSIVGASV